MTADLHTETWDILIWCIFEDITGIYEQMDMDSLHIPSTSWATHCKQEKTCNLGLFLLCEVLLQTLKNKPRRLFQAPNHLRV